MSIAVSLLIFAALAFWMVRSDRQKRAADDGARNASAQAHGWRYLRDPRSAVDFHFCGECDGLPWTLDFHGDSESDGGKTGWRMESLRAPRPELLIAHPARATSLEGAMGEVIKAIAKQSEKAAFTVAMYGLPHRVETGSEAFRQRFIARAEDPDLARRVLDETVQQMLLRDPRVTVTWSPRGLEIQCDADLHELAEQEHMIELGCAIARRLRPIPAA